MDCPHCHNAYEGSVHCTMCGWREPASAVDETEPSLPADAPQTSTTEGPGALTATVTPAIEAPSAERPPSAPPADAPAAAGKPVVDGAVSPAGAARAVAPIASNVTDALALGPDIVTPAAERPPSEGRARVDVEVEQTRLTVTATERSTENESPKEERLSEPQPKKSAPSKKESETAAREPAPPPEPARGASSIKLNKSKAKKVIQVKGDNGIFTDYLLQIFGESETRGDAPPSKTYVDLTTILPERQSKHSGDDAFADVETMASRLRRERLLFVSCVDLGIARAAVHSVVDTLGLPRDLVRILDFDRLADEGARLTVYELLKNPAPPHPETMIVVDGVSHRAQTFLDSFLGASGLWTAQNLAEVLATNQLLLVCCLTEPPHWTRFASGHQDLPFAQWPVPFLSYLLRQIPRHRRDEVERAIRQQRAAGRWSAEDAEFCGQVSRLINQGRLIETVEAGGMPPSNTPAGLGFSDDKPVHNAVLYAATFYPSLNPTEFNRVVTKLVGDETTSVTTTVTKIAADGTTRVIEVTKERRLEQLWREGADRILRECRLVTQVEQTGVQTGVRVLAFADSGRREHLREHFETEYGFYVQTKFNVAHQAGLLFDPSDQIADNVVRLTVDMACSFPDSYGSAWLLELYEEAKTSARVNGPVLFKRMAQLLRGFSQLPSLEPLVDKLLKRLLSSSASVLLVLIKEPSLWQVIDGLYWVQQLIDQGNAVIRTEAYRFLYMKVENTEAQVYAILHALESWLPAPDRERHSPSNTLALRLLLDYAVDKANRFKSARYGEWPSPYPLFAIANAADATSELKFLIGWLLHPGMAKATAEAVDSGSPDIVSQLLAALIAEWMFILYGPTGNPSEAPEWLAGTDSDGAAPLSADTMATILLKELVARTAGPSGRAIRKAMLAFWDEAHNALLDAINLVGPANRTERAVFVWKRKLVRILVIRFRALQRAPQPPVAAAS